MVGIFYFIAGGVAVGVFAALIILYWKLKKMARHIREIDRATVTDLYDFIDTYNEKMREIEQMYQKNR